MNLHDLRLRVRALISRRRVEGELDEELAFHVECEAEKYVAAGLSPAEARARALARFGPLTLAADHCRDARGTALVDDLARDILYAFRTFRRAPLAAMTIVTTVALGLGLVAAVFAVYNMIFLRVDAVRNPAELFAVEGEGSRTFTRVEFEAMRRETRVFTDAVAMLGLGFTRLEGRPAASMLVSGNFFQMLGVQAALGRTLTPADDEPSAGRSVIVLSYSEWKSRFEDDPAVIGRSVRISDRSYEIVGVMPEDFRGLQIASADYWAPLALAGQFRDVYAGAESGFRVQVVGRLKPGLLPQTAAAGLNLWMSARNDRKLASERPASISLRPHPGTLPPDLESLMAWGPIFFAFGLILMIGCANVANLLLARGVSRQREIGIRLALGASRQRILRQLVTENLLLALAGASCGSAVSQLFLKGVVYATTSTVPPELLEVDLLRFAPTMDWRVVLFLLAGAVLSTVLFGLAPALQATRLELVRTMRGEVTRDARPGRARHALIAVQAGASALLLICAVIFLRGAFAATADTGIRTSDTVRISIANEPRRAALLQAVIAHPSVAAVAASSLPRQGISENLADGATPTRVGVELLAVSHEYFNLLGIDIVSGRAFTQAERTADAGVVVVSETVARQLWPARNAIGQVMRLQILSSDARGASDGPARTFAVVGVARDTGKGNSLSYLFGFRGVYLPTGSESARTWLFLRVNGDPDQTRQALLESLGSVDPDLTIITLRSMAAIQTYVLGFASWVTIGLAALGLLLTATGLFSVLSYVIEQRAKEIGVRMALGATPRNVVALVLAQSFRPVGLGLAAGGGLAAALAAFLMATPLASELEGIVRVLDPVAYAASVLIIGAACLLGVSVPALRAASIDPIATLRQD